MSRARKLIDKSVPVDREDPRARLECELVERGGELAIQGALTLGRAVSVLQSVDTNHDDAVRQHGAALVATLELFRERIAAVANGKVSERHGRLWVPAAEQEHRDATAVAGKPDGPSDVHAQANAEQQDLAERTRRGQVLHWAQTYHGWKELPTYERVENRLVRHLLTELADPVIVRVAPAGDGARMREFRGRACRVIEEAITGFSPRRDRYDVWKQHLENRIRTALEERATE